VQFEFACEFWYKLTILDASWLIDRHTLHDTWEAEIIIYWTSIAVYNKDLFSSVIKHSLVSVITKQQTPNSTLTYM